MSTPRYPDVIGVIRGNAAGIAWMQLVPAVGSALTQDNTQYTQCVVAVPALFLLGIVVSAGRRLSCPGNPAGAALYNDEGVIVSMHACLRVCMCACARPHYAASPACTGCQRVLVCVCEHSVNACGR